ncbi:unnamed protein product [Cyberlindnera jadinii]|uniref:Regulator of rDNA transcription 14 n=1 Tax=Cyberlindnera jadinii (strain ATCC 18201 / CBS 1600 / BCRC 20928 / JCM 3617 / NBRC 0987 / NRRL Y-1542) TaxID=983966 RepID=A0A0H5C0F3_CYBJN|nr:hypothetical protein CYBJADRAFT_187979 [Cyberlindnera jadinii NRRL Y-1542]ODV76287.1 hypothetical protein CYBJADRAFT_187979 [Cyberlindnera jadinii NRRL Y-1542]CEP20937.1 unnamed protein product [Cyberlindnera jadinii]
MAIQFQSSASSASQVNKLLDSLLPGNSVSSTDQQRDNVTSTSQIINMAQKKLKPEEIRRIQKKERHIKRQKIRKQRDQKDHVESTAKYELLQQHAKTGNLTNREKKELKKLINRNVVSLQSWKTEAADQIEDLQREILQLKNTDRSKKRVKQKVLGKDLYKKKLERKYPGLTPGLAPVGLSDSDDSDDE